MLGFEQQEGRRRRRHTWWLLVAGEWPDQDLGAAAAAAAAVARSSPRGRERARGVNGREKEGERCSLVKVLIHAALDPQGTTLVSDLT